MKVSKSGKNLCIIYAIIFAVSLILTFVWALLSDGYMYIFMMTYMFQEELLNMLIGIDSWANEFAVNILSIIFTFCLLYGFGYLLDWWTGELITVKKKS